MMVHTCPICTKPSALHGPCFRCDVGPAATPPVWEVQLMKDLYTLIVQRLRSGVGPDPELDVDIAALVGHRAPLPYTAFVAAAFTLLPIGFWWRGGSSQLSSEVRVAPDYNDPEHRERLLKDYPQTLRHWDKGVEVEIRPGGDGSFARAFAAVCLVARAARTVGGPPPSRTPCAIRWRY
jgi:hypothetical protein